MAETVQPDTWGAVFIARTDKGLDEDIASIASLGFTVLGTSLRAGETILTGYGPGSSVAKFTSDFDLKYRIVGRFFLMSEGSPLTIDEIRKWAPLQNLAF